LKPIPFGKPYIGKEEEDAVLAVLRSGWLTTGKETLSFEKEFGYFLESGGLVNGNLSSGEENIHCLAVNWATSGLHLALEALGLGKGDLVIVPSFTFSATAAVVR